VRLKARAVPPASAAGAGGVAAPVARLQAGAAGDALSCAAGVAALLAGAAVGWLQPASANAGTAPPTAAGASRGLI